MTNVLILGANGQISRLVIERLLTETDFYLTLFLRRSHRILDLVEGYHERVAVIEGDIHNTEQVLAATQKQDLVFVSMVDHDTNNAITKNVINAMKQNNVSRVISANVLGIYDEVPLEFGRWNKATIGKAGLDSARNSDKLYELSGLTYTTLRLPWLNDRDEVDYVITHRNESYLGVSGSRQSMADVIVRIAKNLEFLANDSVGIANASTQGSTRPVY